MPTLPTDQDRNRLWNALRILRTPANALYEAALNLRTEISDRWQLMAQAGEWVSSETIGEEWMLAYLGYHVGDTRSVPEAERRSVLDYVLDFHLPPIHGPEYYTQWGEPGTKQRWNNLVRVLSNRINNAKLNDENRYRRAIAEWQRDREYVQERSSNAAGNY